MPDLLPSVVFISAQVGALVLGILLNSSSALARLARRRARAAAVASISIVLAATAA